MDTEIQAEKIDYQIKTVQFEGPLDLLLQLIEKRKLFISDFSLAKVADEYIGHIRSFQSFPVSDVANFLIIASALVLLKSKSLLPNLSLSLEENENIDDLKRRLNLYEHFRTLALSIKERYGRAILFERTHRPSPVTMFAPDKRISPSYMHTQVLSVIGQLPKEVSLPKATIRKVISLEEMLEKLAEKVTVALKLSFSEFTRYKKGEDFSPEVRVEIIVGFLAMLELVKQGSLQVTQHEEHGDIHMENQNITTPAYV